MLNYYRYSMRSENAVRSARAFTEERSIRPFEGESKPKLMDQLREALRSRHYSRQTEQTYCQWVERFILFQNVRHPAEMGEPEINDFLTHLAIQDVDFSCKAIMVRDGKGAKDRLTVLPEKLENPLREHLRKVKAIHERDLAEGWGRVQLPNALDRKYSNASAEWRGP